MRTFPTARFLAVAGALWLACGAARAQQSDAVDRSAPAATAVYLSADANSLRTFWEQAKDSPLAALLDRAPAKAGPPRAIITQGLALFTQAFGDQVGLAIADAPASEKAPPPVLAIFPIKGQQEAQTLVGLATMEARSGKAKMTTREYQGATITTITQEAKPAKDEPAKDEPVKSVSYTFLPDRVLVSNQAEWLEKGIDTTAGRAEGLATRASFTGMRARVANMGPGAAWFWVDAMRMNQRALELAEKAPKKAGADGKPAVPPMKFDVLKQMSQAYTTVGGLVLLGADGISVEGSSLVNTESEFGRKFLAQKGSPMRSAALTSGGATLYVGMNNLPFLVETVRMVLGAVQGDAGKMIGNIGQTFQAATGLDPQADLMNHLGGEVALVLNGIPSDLKSLPVLLYVQTANKAAMVQSMEKLRAKLAEAMGVQFVAKDLPQGRLYTLDAKTSPIPFALGWTFAGDYLVIGSSDALKSPLYLAKGVGTSLAAGRAYQQAVATVDDRLLSVFTLDLSKVLPVLAKMSSSKKPGKDGKPAKPIDPEVMEALKAFRTISASAALEGDAVAFRLQLGLDLK